MKTYLIGLGFCLCVLAFHARAIAGEYYTYRNAKGVLVITNKKPPAGTKILKKQTFRDSAAGKGSPPTEGDRPINQTQSPKGPKG
jgi:hypothetical protein